MTPSRKSLTITGLDLDVRLNTAAQQLAARALLTVRNTGTTPLSQIPLQISSSLNWERIRVAGRDVSYPLATINSDSDHTGQLHEAAVPLAEPIAPGATVQLDVIYSGAIAATARRLLSVGTPEDSASHSDWDEISPAFTGLRGFGNVVWYPVVSVPVIIGDGARLFDEIGRQKLRSSGTEFRLRLTVEFPHGQAPTSPQSMATPSHSRLSTHRPRIPTCPASRPPTPVPTRLTFESPSLFVATQAAHPGTHLAVYTVPEDEPAAQNWLTAATNVSPMIERWLGPNPRTSSRSSTCQIPKTCLGNQVLCSQSHCAADRPTSSLPCSRTPSPMHGWLPTPTGSTKAQPTSWARFGTTTCTIAIRLGHA